MPHRRVPTWLAAACLAATVTACSSSGPSGTRATPATSTTPTPTPIVLSAAAYRQALHQVALEEDAAQHQVQQAFHASAVAQLRAGLTTFAADQHHAAHQLTTLTPPANAVAANSQLAQAFTHNATAIDALLTKLATTKTVKQALTIVQNDHAAQQVGHEIDTALAKLKRLGYTAGS
jgi:hypothetical protein